MTNRTDDIDGATVGSGRYARQKANRQKKEMNRANFFTTADIEGAQAKPLHRHTNKPNFFSTRDIDGAQPKRNHFHTARRVDPLDPKYTLPKSEPIEPAPTRFLRDSMDYSDVEGTKSAKYYRWKQRDSHNVDDIEGASAKWKPHRLRNMKGTATRDTLDVSDIMREGFVTSRSTNPMMPEYHIHGNHIAATHKSKPKPLPRETNTPFFSLSTNDVPGAKAGFKYFPCVKEENRRQFRQTNRVDDIKGAVPDTLKRGLVSKRTTNPLQPNYKLLDGQLERTWKQRPQPDVPNFRDSRNRRIQRLESELASTKKELAQLRKSRQADIEAVKNLPETV